MAPARPADETPLPKWARLIAKGYQVDLLRCTRRYEGFADC
jgi:hypothetical protein